MPLPAGMVCIFEWKEQVKCKYIQIPLPIFTDNKWGIFKNFWQKHHCLDSRQYTTIVNISPFSGRRNNTQISQQLTWKWESWFRNCIIYMHLIYCAGACLSAALTGMAAAIFCDTCLFRAARVFSVSCRGHILIQWLVFDYKLNRYMKCNKHLHRAVD